MAFLGSWLISIGPREKLARGSSQQLARVPHQELAGGILRQQVNGKACICNYLESYRPPSSGILKTTGYAYMVRPKKSINLCSPRSHPLFIAKAIRFAVRCHRRQSHQSSFLRHLTRNLPRHLPHVQIHSTCRVVFFMRNRLVFFDCRGLHELGLLFLHKRGLLF